MLVVKPEKKLQHIDHVFKKTSCILGSFWSQQTTTNISRRYFIPRAESVVEQPINIKVSEQSRSGVVNCSAGQVISRLSEPESSVPSLQAPAYPETDETSQRPLFSLFNSNFISFCT
jgi:hypothetical protein